MQRTNTPPRFAETRILRGPWLTLTADPFATPWKSAYRYESDGAIALKNGLIHDAGAADTVLPALGPDFHGCPVEDYRSEERLILPGFIDCHVHYPQLQVIGSYGTQLIEWLDRYTFPAEQAFADPIHARRIARLFLQELLRVGTTTAATFCTVHPHSAEILFEEAERLDMRLIAGKVMMDRNAPEALRDTVASSYEDSRRLIERWHGRGRALYAITPRFAISSTPEQLEAAGALWRAFPDVYVQSHLSENTDEVAWVQRLFPDRRDYLDVYDHYGLVGPRSLYGHCLHLTEREWRRLEESGGAIACCPTSNLFIGSGLFDLRRARCDGSVRVGLSSDVGGGTTLSLLQTLNESYKMSQLRGFSLNAVCAFWLMTRGAAETLSLSDRIGSIAPGREADLTILDLTSTPLIRCRMETVQDIVEALFVQMTIGDDRAIFETWVSGRRAHQRDAVKPDR